MARKQKDYLTALLADEIDNHEADATGGEPEGASAPRADRARRNSLLGRESALARVASGEVRQVTQIALDPARVRPWAGNARSYNHLNEENCRELIDAIIRILDILGSEGNDKHPAGTIFEEKRAFNRSREDHKPENRIKEGGKAF